MNRKKWLIEVAQTSGRKCLHGYCIGVIDSIIENSNISARNKVIEIARTLKDLRLVFNNEFLPWDAADAKKAPALTEAPKEILHPDCIVNVTQKQSSLDPWPLEQIIDERRGVRFNGKSKQTHP